MATPFILVVALLAGAEPRLAPLRGFSTLDDCRSALEVSDFLAVGPMKAVCIDANSFETVISVSRNQ